MTDPSQDPSQTRRKMPASDRGSDDMTRRTRASVCYVADPTHAVRQSGHGGNPTAGKIQELRRLKSASATPANSVHVIGSQRYVCLDWVPHTNKHGFASVVFKWATQCAECGKPMMVSTSAKRLPETRRCAEHAKPGRRAA